MCLYLSSLSLISYLHLLSCFKMHIVLQHSIFCKRQLSPAKQSHLLKWLKWKQYFLWIPMFAREHLSTLSLYSHFNFIYSSSFFFSCVHVICNIQLWVFCLTWQKHLPCYYFFQLELCGDTPSTHNRRYANLCISLVIWARICTRLHNTLV